MSDSVIDEGSRALISRALASGGSCEMADVTALTVAGVKMSERVIVPLST